MRLTFKETTSKIGIPYVPEERPGGRPNLGYFDLKRRPELIPTIPELEGVPELLSLVKELNHPSSIVRSLACEWASGPNNDPIVNHKLTSFLRLCFELLTWNSPGTDNYRKLFDNCKQFIRTNAPQSEFVLIDFERDDAAFHDHKFGGHALTIWHNGYGCDEVEARNNWAMSVRATEHFFSVMRRDFQNELDKGGVTIS